MTDEELIKARIERIEKWAWGHSIPDRLPDLPAFGSANQLEPLKDKPEGVTDEVLARAHDAYYANRGARWDVKMRAALEAALPSGVRGLDRDELAELISVAGAPPGPPDGPIRALPEDHFVRARAYKQADAVIAYLAAIEPTQAPQPTYAEAVAPYAAAIRMIGDGIEQIFGPLASLESEEATLLRGPEPHHRAEGILEALQRVAARLSASAGTPQTAPASHQERVAEWMQQCFGPEISADKVERVDRFIEEALELAQATGWTADRARALIDYVFARPVGEIGQEIGGVMVTLAALCEPFGYDMQVEAKREVDRITSPNVMEKIRAKQAAKPTGSALPIAMADPLRTNGGDSNGIR